MEMPVNQFRTMGRPGRIDLAEEHKRKNALVIQALESLWSEGHTVLAWGSGPGKPFVWLAPSKKLANLADEFHGAYYLIGQDEHGPFRKGILLDYRNVNVTWMERGH